VQTVPSAPPSLGGEQFGDANVPGAALQGTGLRKSAKGTLGQSLHRRGLIVVVNSSIAVGFVQGQLQYFQNRGFDVTLICPERRKDEWEVARPEGISVVETPIERKIALLRDLRSLWRLWRTIRALKPVVTNVATPKAGLLGGLAAWLNRVPCRFYTLHGLRFETTKGLKRRLLICAEKLACFFADRVVCVSHSVRENAIAYGLTTRERAVVFGAGSCNGVDFARFAPTPDTTSQAAELRRRLGIPAQATVVTFVGRLTRDKGIPELMESFSRLDKKFRDLRLLLVGCFEDQDPLPASTRKSLETHPHVIFAGAVRDTPAYYALADIVVLPSHREGLPTVILEAKAAGKPVIGASATGILDVVADGQTGLLFPAGDVGALTSALARLLIDKDLAAKLALAGQEQVKRDFQQERVWEALHQAYFESLRLKEPRPSYIQSSGGRNSLGLRSNDQSRANVTEASPNSSPAQ
jgi:glycosyltransferase involved in cell wall biosynthesis